jgi:hypothetical protein
LLNLPQEKLRGTTCFDLWKALGIQGHSEKAATFLQTVTSYGYELVNKSIASCIAKSYKTKNKWFITNSPYDLKFQATLLNKQCQNYGKKYPFTRDREGDELYKHLVEWLIRLVNSLDKEDSEKYLIQAIVILWQWDQDFANMPSATSPQREVEVTLSPLMMGIGSDLCLKAFEKMPPRQPSWEACLKLASPDKASKLLQIFISKSKKIKNLGVIFSLANLYLATEDQLLFISLALKKAYTADLEKFYKEIKTTPAKYTLTFRQHFESAYQKKAAGELAARSI